MGAAQSKTEEDKSLSLCQERKRFVREALDGRCSLAATHFSYVESLRNTGVALRKFAQSDTSSEYSDARDPLASNQNPQSQFPNLSPEFSKHDPITKNQNPQSQFQNLSPQLSKLDPLARNQKPGSQFPDLSPEFSKQDSCSPETVSPRRFHVNHMKASRILAKTVEEKPPVSMKAMVEESINFEEPPLAPPGGWDYFGIFHPTEDQYSLDEPQHTEDINRVRQEEGIPELEEEEDLQEEELIELKELEDDNNNNDDGGGGDLSGDGFGDTEEEDEFDESSSKEPLVRIFKNRNNLEDLGSDNEGQSGHKESNYESDESLTGTPDFKRNLGNKYMSNNVYNNNDGKEETGNKTPVRNPNLMLNRDILENYESDESRTGTPNFKRNNVYNNNNNIHEKEDSENKTPVHMQINPNFTINHDISSIEDMGSVVNGKQREDYNNPNGKNRAINRDLFFCMKEIEELFIKAAESGKEVPRMLEADNVNFRPFLPDENGQKQGISNFIMSFFGWCGPDTPPPQPVSAPIEATNLIRQRSVSSQSSSSRNPVGDPNKDNINFNISGGVYMNSGSHVSTLDRRNPVGDPNKDNIDFNISGGVYMNSGSHVSTLDRLYAWERKLYDEVKASGAIRRDYDFKCKLLRHQESRGESQYRIDKTRSSVKDLHSRIRVAIQRIDKISKTIEEIRDKELQPQLEELIEGLIRMWGVMLDCHRKQLDLLVMTSSNGSAKLSIRPESQSQATLTLVNELNHLCSNFTKCITAHKSYLISINKWVHKCVSPLEQNPKKKKKKKYKQDFSLRDYGPPPIFVTCEEWLKLLEVLPTNEVVNAIKELSNVTSHFLPRQDKRSKGFKSSLSLATNGVSNDEINGRNNGLLVESSLNCDSLQSSLLVFLEKLVDFADKSFKNYEALQQSIRIAQDDYLGDQYRR